MDQKKMVMMQVNNFQKLSFLNQLKFIYSEKATKFCKIFIYLLTAVHTEGSRLMLLLGPGKIRISQKSH